MERYDNYRNFEKSMGIKTIDKLDQLKNAIEWTGYCYNKVLVDKVINAYSKMLLSDYSIDVALEACKQIVKQEQYFPSVQVLLSKCREIQNTKPKEQVKDDCEKCSNTGRIYILDEKSNKDITFRCDCETGSQYKSFKCISEA